MAKDVQADSVGDDGVSPRVTSLACTSLLFTRALLLPVPPSRFSPGREAVNVTTGGFVPTADPCVGPVRLLAVCFDSPAAQAAEIGLARRQGALHVDVVLFEFELRWRDSQGPGGAKCLRRR